MINVTAAVGCAFFAGVYMHTDNAFSFWLNAILSLANLVFVWHHYSKNKEG